MLKRPVQARGQVPAFCSQPFLLPESQKIIVVLRNEGSVQALKRESFQTSLAVLMILEFILPSMVCQA
jgi:hypothetical protein